MIRYQKLMNRTLAEESLTVKSLSQRLKISAPAAHNYLDTDVLPRIDNLQKIGRYYNEPIGELLSTDDDLTVELIKAVRNISEADKKALYIQLTGEPYVSQTPSNN